MAKDQAQTDITDLARQTQALFKLNGAAVPQVEQVLKAQQSMLEQAETFTRHWIERRQEAVETALEAMTEMQSADKSDPAAAMRAIADWQRGSVERLTTDMQEWMALCMQAGQLTTAAQSKSAQSKAPSSGSDKGKATGSKGQSASSSSKSGHATPV